MKYIINRGGYRYAVPQEVQETLCCGRYDWYVRSNPYFIDWVEEHFAETDLRVVTIPSNATDWELSAYDAGWESIIAVVDGKIVHLYGK